MSGVALGRYHAQAIDVPSLRNVFTDKFMVEGDINDLKLQLKPVTLPAYASRLRCWG